MVGAGLGGDTARQDGEGSRPHGSDRLLIKPAAMVTRPVPAVRGHFERKARPATAGYEGPLALPAPASTHQRQESNQPACRRRATSLLAVGRPVTIRATRPADTNPIRSPGGNRRQHHNHEPQEYERDDQSDQRHAGGAPHDRGVPAHPAVVQDWWRDGGHRRSVADPNSACHRPPSRSLLAQLALRTALLAGRLGRDPGRGHGSTSLVVSAGWCPRVRLRPRGRRGGPT